MAEHEITLRMDFRPAEVTANFDEMAERLKEFMEPYEGMDAAMIATMPIAEVKTARADINKVINSVEDGRKAMKAEYNKSLAAFEAQVKALLKPARDAEALLKDAVDEHLRKEREVHWRNLESYYNEVAPLLAPVVPLETILPDKKWRSKSNLKAAHVEIARVSGGLEKDWATLKREQDSLFDYAECERDLFTTLDLQGVLERDDARRAQAERISDMKWEMGIPQEPEPAAPVIEPVPYTGEVLHRYRITADITPTAKDELIRVLKAMGLTKDAGVHITLADLGEVRDA